MYSADDFLARRDLERQIILEGTNVWNEKKRIDAQRDIEEKKQLRVMLKSYNPWGKPGYGAPNPGCLRKQKLILDEPDISNNVTSVLTLGRPGHGAPLRTESGRTKTYLRADPSIRFQFHEPSRRSVDNDLRYRTSPKDKENYRRQLDAIIVQKRQLQRTTSQSSPGRDKKEGWSNEVTLRRLPHQESEQVYAISGGVELVPLMARHRASPRCPLPTTDITRISRLQNGPPKTAEPEISYHNALSCQVNQRQQQQQEARINDMVSSQRHFDTWKGLWGRPGHGAPKGRNLAKEKLEVILYELPARRLTAA